MLTVDQLFKLHDELCQAGKKIMESKNHDYRGGSGDPLANFRGSTVFGINEICGILLRVQDKLMRIKTFAEKGELLVKGEGVMDAVIDVMNYMVLIAGFISECQYEQRDSEEKKGVDWEQVARDFNKEVNGLSKGGLIIDRPTPMYKNLTSQE